MTQFVKLTVAGHHHLDALYLHHDHYHTCTYLQMLNINIRWMVAMVTVMYYHVLVMNPSLCASCTTVKLVLISTTLIRMHLKCRLSLHFRANFSLVIRTEGYCDAYDDTLEYDSVDAVTVFDIPLCASSGDALYVAIFNKPSVKLSVCIYCCMLMMDSTLSSLSTFLPLRS